ncbi:MAG: CatB-related O-acetyltransferase [Pseudomonadota bacterium]
MLPDPDILHPIRLPDGAPHLGTVHLAVATDHPRIEVGRWTYASAHRPPEDWAAALAPYLYPFSPERLRIGAFCQIADGVRFVTASANHATSGATCFPFAVHDPDRRADFHPDTRDTAVGHDVWIGTGALICPGTRIGDGAVIGAGAVVRGTVPDYAVVTGNPATVVRHRFGTEDVARLKRLAWWDWPRDRIEAAIPALERADLDALEALA